MASQYYKDPTTGQVQFIGNPELNPDLVKGKIETDYQGNAITSGDLTPATPLNLPPQPQEPDYKGITGAIPQIDLNAFFAPTSGENTQDDITKQLLSLTESLGGKESAQLQAERQAGLPQLRQQLQDSANQLQALQKEQAAIPLQIQQEALGKGVTRAGIAPIETARLRENAIKALSVSAIAQTLQGNVALAQSQVDRAIDIEFGQQEQKLKFLQTAYEMNKDVLERQDKKRATALTIQLAERDRLLQDQKEARKQVYDVSLMAAQSGADNATISKLQNARSPQEAITLAGSFLGEEFRQKVFQQQFERDLQKAQFNLAIDKFEEDKKQFGMEYALNQKKLAIDEFKALAEAGGDSSLNNLAYAQQYAADGKIPTGMPKGAFGAISQMAKELPKPKGTVVDINTGVKSAATSDTLQGAYGTLYSVIELAKELKDLDKQRWGGVVSGTLGKVIGNEDQQKYIDLRDQIADLLARARTGAAINATEEKRYYNLLPSRFDEPFGFGADSQTRIDNFVNNITKDLENKTATQGLAIYGLTKVKINDQDYTVGDIINVNGLKGRILPNGEISILE